MTFLGRDLHVKRSVSSAEKESRKMKGPTYTPEEILFLDKLARKGGSPAALVQEFHDAFGEDRTKQALTQKIRKLMLEVNPHAPPRPRGRPPKDPAKIAAAARGGSAPFRQGRPVAKAQPVRAVAEVNGNGNGHGYKPVSGEEITIDLGGLKLVGTRRRVAETLLQLGG